MSGKKGRAEEVEKDKVEEEDETREEKEGWSLKKVFGK